MACEPFDCDECGQRHERCRGHSIRCTECDWSGGNVDPSVPCIHCGGVCIKRPCKRWPIKHLTVCDSHGAGNAISKKTSERRGFEVEVRKLINVEDARPVVNPYLELQELAGEILYIKDVFREKVNELVSLKDIGGDRVATQIDVIVSAYERGVDRAEHILTNMARLNLQEQIALLQAKIDDATALIVQRALEGALGKVALGPEDRESVLREFGSLLRSGGASKDPQKAPLLSGH